MKLKAQIERGVELLVLAQELQSAKDGIARPTPGVIDRTKTLDQFAKDVDQAVTDMLMLRKLVSMMLDIAAIGRKLLEAGKIELKVGDSLSDAAIRYLNQEYGI